MIDEKEEIVAISHGVFYKDKNIFIDKKIITKTVSLLNIWNRIFKSVGLENKEYTINEILKKDSDLLYNLNFLNLLKTLEETLLKEGISLNIKN